jgi:signal transduction histidine kinase
MSARDRLILYLIAVHLALAAVAVWLAWDDRVLLIPLEIVFAFSLLLGVRLIKRLFVPIDLVRRGADLIAERDFSSHFRPVGEKEMDALVDTYNAMIDRLREERVRLEEQHLLFQKVIAAAPIAFLTCDFDGRIDQVNPEAEALFGKSASELRGAALGGLDHPLAAPLAALADGESAVLPVDGRRYRGLAAAFVDRGFPRRFYLLEELTRELHESERAAYETLIRMVSHEVNNSVGAVGSLLESSAQLAEARGELAQVLSIAIERLRTLNRFTNALAELVRVPPPQPREEDLGALLRDIVTVVRPEAESRRVAIELTLPPGAATIALMDKNQMERVLINVLRNAVEAAGAGGRVEVAVDRDGGRPAIRVRDSGPGVAPEAASFTPFYTTKPGGHGLGLALVREILTQHGFAHSLRTHPEGGAEFRIEM